MPKRYHHGDLKRALLDEAIRQAGEVGLEHLSLRELAVKLGVTHPAAYHHFASKDELLAALAREGFQLLDARLAAVSSKAPRKRFVELGLSYVAFARENPVHFRLMFRASVVKPIWGPEMIALTGSPFAQVHDAVLQAGGTRDLTDLAWVAMHGLATLALDGPLALRGDDVDELAGRLASLLARLLPGKNRAARTTRRRKRSGRLSD
jgi:AcrR family transcriptional regulator